MVSFVSSLPFLTDHLLCPTLIPPTIDDNSAVISACDRGGAWDMALMMLDEARETRFGHDPAATGR